MKHKRPHRAQPNGPRDPRPSKSAARPSSQPAEPSRTGAHKQATPAAPDGNVEVVYGLRAVEAVLRVRPQDIVNVRYTAAMKPELGALISFAGSKHIDHALCAEGELTRMADSNQHEGVCITTAPRRWTTPKALTDQLLTRRGVAIAFDRVRNPYNIGAILRSAAFFGIDGAILGMPAPHPALSPQAVRVAEGGAEHVSLARTTDLADTLTRMRASGITLVGAEDDGSHNALGYTFKRPCVLVLGHEREGISAKVRALCDAMVAIPGASQVQSLNVSIAASILIAEIQRGTLRR